MPALKSYVLCAKICFLCAFSFIVLYIFIDFKNQVNVYKLNETKQAQNKKFNSRKIHKDINVEINPKKPNKLSSTKQLKKFVFSQRNEKIRNMFLDRTERIRRVCREYKNRTSNKDFFLLKAYSLEPLEKLAICRTAKHGSTTWAKNFIHIYLG